MTKTNLLTQAILIGRSVFASLITEFNANNVVSRLVIKNDDDYVLAWTRCNGEEDYKRAVLRLAKKLKRRISYVYIIPVVEDEEVLDLRVKRSRLEFS